MWVRPSWAKNGVHNKSETHAPFRIAETRADCCRGERKSLHNQRPLISLICSQLGFWWTSASSNSNWGCCVFCCSLSSLSDESPNTSLKSALLLLWSSISIWLKMILTRLWEREREIEAKNGGGYRIVETTSFSFIIFSCSIHVVCHRSASLISAVYLPKSFSSRFLCFTWIMRLKFASFFFFFFPIYLFDF